MRQLSWWPKWRPRKVRWMTAPKGQNKPQDELSRRTGFLSIEVQDMEVLQRKSYQSQCEQ